MDADFSTFELQYHTAVIRNARFCQDASLEPWDNEPEELLPTTVAELQRIAAFSPHGGLSYESAWEYLFLYNTYYVLDAPYENAPELCQLVLTYDAAFVVRYLSTIRLPLHRLRAAALDEGARALRESWRVALDAQLNQAGYSAAFRARYTVGDVPTTPSESKSSLYQEDEPLRANLPARHDWLLYQQSMAGATDGSH